MSKYRYLFGNLRAEPRARPAGILGAAIVGRVMQAFDTILTWIDRYRQRRTLDGFSDYMLKDIGVTRADADREASKRFWQG